jgi:hypothetical protein
MQCLEGTRKQSKTATEQKTQASGIAEGGYNFLFAPFIETTTGLTVLMSAEIAGTFMKSPDHSAFVSKYTEQKICPHLRLGIATIYHTRIQNAF